MMFRQQAALASRPDMWDFRYQLTVIGQFACNCLAGIVNNGFAIKTDQPHVNVSWQVTGIRRDAWAAANRIAVEEEKKLLKRHDSNQECRFRVRGLKSSKWVQTVCFPSFTSLAGSRPR